MQRAAREHHGGARGGMTRHERGDVMRSQRIVGVKPGDGVVALRGCVLAALRARRVAIVGRRRRQAQVLGVPRVDRGLPHAVGHEDVPAGIRLRAHAVVTAAQHVEALAEVGRDNGNAQRARGAERPGRGRAARVVADRAGLQEVECRTPRRRVLGGGRGSRLDGGEGRHQTRARTRRARRLWGKWLGR